MTPKSNWTLNRQEKSKGFYWQAVIGCGKERRRVTLGYLTEEEAQAALVRLKATGPRLLEAETRTGICADEHRGDEFPPPVVGAMTDSAIRGWALDGRQDVESSIERSYDKYIKEMIRTGQYARLPLGDYYEHLWKPVRIAEAAPGTWEREKHLWKPILAALGSIALQDLDTIRWDAFLRAHADWAGRTKVLHQNAYRVSLNYAAEMNIIKDVHRFRKIKGATVRKTPPPAALISAEVDRLLSVAPSEAHRAMWIVGFSTGTRPGELSAMRWEDVDFEVGTLWVRGTKTALSAASIPLPPAAQEALRVHWEASGHPTEGPCWLYKGRVIGHYRSAIQTAAKRAGLEGKITPNSVRHSFVTLAAMAGVPRAATRAMVRHSQRSEMLERAYEHPRSEQVSEAMAAFPRIGGPAK